MKEFKPVAAIATSIAVLALSVPVASLAADLEHRSAKVTYADLDIDKQSGAHVLYRRLQSASKKVCAVETMQNAGTLRALAEQKRCYRDSLDEAVAKIDNPVLTKIHES